jgi:prepilin-type N-terminal cleavage/methylation domain-containing protein
MRIPHTRRAGFTLVELLVVIALAILLAGLTVGIANSNLADSHKIVNSADRISEWLITAKSRAQRARTPQGVRFFVNGNQITEAQYIEVPEPFVLQPEPSQPASPPRLVLSQSGGTRSLALQGSSLGNVTATAAVLNNVSVGDLLSLPEFGLLIPISNNNPLQVDSALLPDLAGNTSYSTLNFGFYRQARPLLGEPNLQVPAGTMIDVRGHQAEALDSTSILPAPTAGFIDILFAPNGEVLHAGRFPRIIFWVRNTTYLPPATNPRTAMNAAGEMALVVIYPKTGAVATQPVLLPPNFGDPYQAAKDNVNTGL